MIKWKTNPLFAAYVMFLVGLATLGYFAGEYKTDLDHRKNVENQRFSSDLTFYDLPRMTVAVSTNNGKGGKVRLDISLEVPKRDLAIIQDYQPRITERIVRALSDIDLENAGRPSSLAQLHKDLLEKVNSVGSPVPIRDIVFRQFMIM